MAPGNGKAWSAIESIVSDLGDTLSAVPNGDRPSATRASFFTSPDPRRHRADLNAYDGTGLNPSYWDALRPVLNAWCGTNFE